MGLKTRITGAVCSVAVIIGLSVQLHPDKLRSSPEGQALIGNEEGCRRDPYCDGVGVLTVGMGSTGHVENRRYSDEEIATRWVKDVAGAEDCVNRYFRGKDMPQRPFEAMTSLVVNVGCYGVRWNRKAVRPTQIYREAQAGDWVAMCHRIPDFPYSGGKPVLAARRAREEAWCLGH
ncbi:glycoside hydrolase family protein [Salmonella enterica]|nr:lysozyme [Salmonella enterica]EBF1578316.1 lysozyme [Salmonella enterica]EBG8798911.1 lysozyme [Salmonella enterica]EBK9094066.1 lysozyme [Salmonella enterica]EBM1998718.1 lysozyme [Salmonella enterica]